MTDFAARRRIMVDTQVRPSDVTRFPIIEAMLTVPREIFVPDNQREAAYAGENLPLSGARVMLEPRTLSKMLNVLNITGDDLVLDIGCGYGYSAAVISHLAEAVVAVEPDEAMAAEAPALLAEVGADNVIVHTADLHEGAGEHGPYDVIIVQGGIEELPAAIADQLKEGGRIACLFMEGRLGIVRVGLKSGGSIAWRFDFNAAAPVLPGFEKKRAFAL